MVRFRMIHLISAAVILVVFVVSTALVFVGSFSIPTAMLFTLLNIMGATFPPDPALIDARNPFILASVTIGAVGNIAFTIIFTTLFYQILSSIDIRYLISKQRIRMASKHVIITPVEGIGIELGKRIWRQGIGVVFVDDDGLRVRKALKLGFLALHGDPSSQQALIGARIDSATTVFALSDDDIKNTFVTLAARRANPKIRIVSRVKRIEDISKMERAGARRVILPEAAIGEEIGEFIVSGKITPAA